MTIVRNPARDLAIRGEHAANRDMYAFRNETAELLDFSGELTYFDGFSSLNSIHCQVVELMNRVTGSIGRLATSARRRNRRCSCKPGLERLEDRRVLAVDSILQWNEVMLQANANDHALSAPEQPGPILTARAFAIVSAAMYDAYNSVEPIGQPYLVTAPNARRANADAAVARAAHDALSALYPSQSALFDTALLESLELIPNGRKEDLGQQVGAYVAKKILRARAGDGASDLSTDVYEPNGEPGFHDVDPINPGQGFYASGAMHVTPFAVQSLDQFEARRLDDGTPEGRLEFLQSEEYTEAYNEVKSLGRRETTARTEEQTVIGIYWGYDGRPGLGTPPRLYNQMARTIAEQQRNQEAENARLFALINIAMADAGLTSWNNKYDDAFWRPILGIRGGESDGNPETHGDPAWEPLGAQASNPRQGELNFTPPFPAYTSGHATFGAAAFQTLARFYGRDEISFSFMSDEFNGITHGSDGQVRPKVTRTFSSLTEAKLENAQSRIYLGIHWAFDAADGIKTGDDVANYVFKNTITPNHHWQHPHHDAKSSKSLGGTGGVSTPNAALETQLVAPPRNGMRSPIGNTGRSDASTSSSHAGISVDDGTVKRTRGQDDTLERGLNAQL